ATRRARVRPDWAAPPPPPVARPALAAQLDSRPVSDAGGNLHLEAARSPLPAGAAAVRARVLDDRPVSAAARARVRERKEALLLGHDSPAVALRADGRRRARLRPGSMADVA